MHYSNKFINDIGILRKYGNEKYKLVDMKFYRQKGIEEDNKVFTQKGKAGNDEKLGCSLSRSRSKVFELAMCNPWELFVTFTIDKAKYDRMDLKIYFKDLTQFIRDYRKKYGCKVKYLLIPERHKDGAWHLHGLLMGLPESHLHEFQLNENLPQKIKQRINEGKRVYTWTAYANKFGFSDIEFIENNEAASKYITKYITKEALNTITELNAHIYYASKGLTVSEIIQKDMLVKSIDNADYENDYCVVKWYDNQEAPLQLYEA